MAIHCWCWCDGVSSVAVECEHRAGTDSSQGRRVRFGYDNRKGETQGAADWYRQHMTSTLRN